MWHLLAFPYVIRHCCVYRWGRSIQKCLCTMWVFSLSMESPRRTSHSCLDILYIIFEQKHLGKPSCSMRRGMGLSRSLRNLAKVQSNPGAHLSRYQWMAWRWTMRSMVSNILQMPTPGWPEWWWPLCRIRVGAVVYFRFPAYSSLDLRHWVCWSHSLVSWWWRGPSCKHHTCITVVRSRWPEIRTVHILYLSLNWHDVGLS